MNMSHRENKLPGQRCMVCGSFKIVDKKNSKHCKDCGSMFEVKCSLTGDLSILKNLSDDEINQMIGE